MKQKQTAKPENSDLGQAPLGRLLWRFALPCVLSLLVSSLYNICDQIYIGHAPALGYLGNAATSIVFPLTVVGMGFALCFGDGAAAYLSLSQGRGDTKKVHRGVGGAILATIIVSILIMGLGFAFTDPILTAFGASATSLPLARDYFVYILAGMMIFMLGNTLNPIIRADGSPQVAMAATLAGAITNIILDPVFIYDWGLGMGIQGAAIATVIGQIITLVISVVYLFRSRVFKLNQSSFALDWSLFGTTFQLGVSTLITQMSIVVVSLLTNMSLAKYGGASVYGVDIPIAVIGIVMKVFMIVMSIAIGVSVGAQPIYGYNYGAGHYARVRRLYRLVMLALFVVGLAGTVFFQFFPETVSGIFGTGSALYEEFAVRTFRIFLSLISLTCLIRATAITFQALGKPVQATIVSLTRDIVCYIPLIFILPNYYGLDGILYAAPIADVIGIIAAGGLAIPFFRRLDTTSCEQTTAQVFASCETK